MRLLYLFYKRISKLSYIRVRKNFELLLIVSRKKSKKTLVLIRRNYELSYIFKYLQAVLKKFYLISTFNKAVLIWYFYDRLKLLIKVQLDKGGYNQDNWDKVIKKAIKYWNQD